MDWLSLLIIIATTIILLFGYVILFGAPYLPTLQPQISKALELVDLEPGQKLYELGSGDGRVVLAAARQGIAVTGYELNPLLVMFAWFRLRKFPNAHVKLMNFWQADIADADGIFVFLLPKYMIKLDTKITQECTQSVKLVSFAFEIPTKKPRLASSGLFLYVYPK